MHILLLTPQGKLLQLCPPDEVLPATSKMQRSLATGQLQLTASKVFCGGANLAARAIQPAHTKQATVGGSSHSTTSEKEPDDDSCFPKLYADGTGQL